MCENRQQPQTAHSEHRFRTEATAWCNADEYPFMATEQKAKGVLTLIKFYEKRVQNEKDISRRLNKAVMYSNSFQCLQNWKELTTMVPTL